MTVVPVRLLALFAAWALAFMPLQPGRAANGAASAPPAGAHGEGGVRLQCGGVGLDESEALRGARGHALQLLFTDMDGAYLAGVEVRIEDAGGTVRAQARCGPVALLHVTEGGRYRVRAVSAGVARSAEFTLTPGAEVRAVLRWLD